MVSRRFFEDVEGVLVELLLGAVALQRQPHHRLGVGLDLGHHRRVHVPGQPRSTWIDLGLDLVEGHVHLLLEGEGDVDRRHPGDEGGLHVLDARHAVHRRLDDVGDAGIDDVGLAPFSVVVIEITGNSMKGSGRRRPLVADDAHQHQHGAHHPRQHVAFDGKLGQGHGSGGGAGAGFGSGLDGDGGAVAEEAGAVLGDDSPGRGP